MIRLFDRGLGRTQGVANDEISQAKGRKAKGTS